MKYFDRKDERSAEMDYVKLLDELNAVKQMNMELLDKLVALRKENEEMREYIAVLESADSINNAT